MKSTYFCKLSCLILSPDVAGSYGMRVTKQLGMFNPVYFVSDCFVEAIMLNSFFSDVAGSYGMRVTKQLGMFNPVYFVSDCFVEAIMLNSFFSDVAGSYGGVCLAIIMNI